MKRPKTPRPPKRSIMTLVFEHAVSDGTVDVAARYAPAGTYVYTSQRTDNGTVRVVIMYRDTQFVCATFECHDIWDPLGDGLFVVFVKTDVFVNDTIWASPPGKQRAFYTGVMDAPDATHSRDRYRWCTLVTRGRGHPDFKVSHVFGTANDTVKRVLRYIDPPESTEVDATRLRVCAEEVRAFPYSRLWSTAWSMEHIQDPAWPICAVARTYLTEKDALRQFNALHVLISLDIEAQAEKE